MRHLGASDRRSRPVGRNCVQLSVMHLWSGLHSRIVGQAISMFGWGMPGVFLSHSSKNNQEALRLQSWLVESGWREDQIFLDVSDLKSGDEWRAVLNALADRDAVIVCLSDEWIASAECVREFTQAQERGKPIFPMFVANVNRQIPRFVTDVQIGDGRTPEGLDGLGRALLAARIAPEAFSWPPSHDPKRSVFRGLSTFHEDDAAIFFGRDRVISSCLSEIRRLHEREHSSVLTILAASGAGKSSFLRAGLLARLHRDRANYIVLPVLRPYAAAISGPQGLSKVTSQALGTDVSIDDVSTFARALHKIRDQRVATEELVMRRAGRNPSTKRPTIIIPIDQAEECCGPHNPEGGQLLKLLDAICATDAGVVAIATVRGDFLEHFQKGLSPQSHSVFSLPPLALDVSTLVRGPASIARPEIAIDPELLDALSREFESSDALALLAFTLERLWERRGRPAKLSLSDYETELGGQKGMIAAAVGTALGSDPSASLTQQLRRLMIPAMIQVDDGGVRRRTATRDELNPEDLPLADRLVEQRLLTASYRVNRGKQERTLELAHDALLRLWPALSTWIDEENTALLQVRSVRSAADDWSANSKVNPETGDEWLIHQGTRLKDAEGLCDRPEFARVLGQTSRSYLSACRVAQDKKEAELQSNLERELHQQVLIVAQLRKRVRQSASAAIAAAAAAALITYAVVSIL